MNTLVYKACNRIWPFLHLQEPKGPQSWNQCQTNHVGSKMAQQMKSWKQLILEEQSTQQNSTEQCHCRTLEVQKDQGLITSGQVSLIVEEEKVTHRYEYQKIL